MEENKYRTSGVVDESTLQEINRLILWPKRMWFRWIATVIIALWAVFMLVTRSYAYFIILAACIALLVWMPRKIRKSTLDNAVKRLHESYASGFMQMETWFTEEGVAMHNLTDGAQLVLSYGSIQMVKETERYFYLLTKANQFTLVFKNMLTPEQKQSFLPYLREKCPDIKLEAGRSNGRTAR